MTFRYIWIRRISQQNSIKLDTNLNPFMRLLVNGIKYRKFCKKFLIRCFINCIFDTKAAESYKKNFLTVK